MGLKFFDDPVLLLVFVATCSFQIRNHLALYGCLFDFLVWSQVFVFLFDFVNFTIRALSNYADHLILFPLWFGRGR